MKPRIATDADLAHEAQQRAKRKADANLERAKTIAAILGCVILAETVALQTLGIAALIRGLRR